MSEETKKPAAATEEAPAPVDPRVEQANAFLEGVRSKIVAAFGDAVIEEAGLAKHQPTLVIQNDKWAEVVDYVKQEPSLAFVYPEAMAGTDYMEKGYIEVYLLVHSFVRAGDLALKVRTPRDEAKVPSVTSTFPGTNWEEREIYDLLGVTFVGHPDLKRIMNTDDWNGHPLRKDYVVQD